MRILIASPYLPWPLNSGGNAAQFSTLKCLEQDHQFTLVCPVFTKEGMSDAKELQIRLPLVKIRAAFCGQPAPMPQPQPGFLIRTAKWFVQCGRRLLARPPEPKESGLPDKHIPYYPFNPLPPQLIRALQDELLKGVDLCQAEFAEMLSLGAWFPKTLPKLFIHHQIHFVYVRRFLDIHGSDGFTTYLAEVMQIQERAYLQMFDGVVVFSDNDRQALESCVPPGKIHASPFPIPADVGLADEVPAKFAGRFVFVASEDHSPNRDALEWLLAEIWPEILRQLPSARLVVIGKWSKTTQNKWSVKGLEFRGFVGDLPATIRGGIMLVPLRIGSGIRVKIMVALAQGVPVVTTLMGCEGMPVIDDADLLVRDTPLEFATAAVKLARIPELYFRLAVAGKSTASKHYSPTEVRRRRNEIYDSVVQDTRGNNKLLDQSPSKIIYFREMLHG